MDNLSRLLPPSEPDIDDDAYESQPDDQGIELQDSPMPSIEETLQNEIHENEEENSNEGVGDVVVLTTGYAHPLVTSNITHIALLPEYPDTSVSGYTYCIQVGPRIREQKQVLEEALQFQYCRRQKGPAKSTTCPFLGGAATRHRLRCTGVKCCQYIHNALRTYSHTKVTVETWEELKRARSSIERISINRQDQNSTSLYIAIMRRFQSGISCPNQSAQCAPVLRQMRNESVSGVKHWYIGCISWNWQTANREKHFFRLLHEKYSIPRLTELFKNGLEEIQQQPEFCGTIETTTSRMRHCNIDHAQGPGQLVHQPCEVTFDIIIPQNLEETPYYLFHSQGVHTHAPPPPHKTPEQLTKEIINLIHQINDPGLTTAKLLCNPFLEELCRKHSATHYNQLHPTLNNLSWLERQIYKTNLILYPSGQDLAGVEFEWRKQRKDPSTAYIQQIHYSKLGTIIICFSREQAQLFINQESFQVDLSFKRISKQNFKEIIFAIFHEKHGKILTLARILINSDRRRVYTLCFKLLFKLLSECVQKEIKWKHLHGEGFIGVTIDMDGKQMAGLGRYLSSIDPLQREWQWQLRNIVRFCQIHFLRSITSTAGTYEDQYSVHHRMRALLTCESLNDYMELCNLLIANESAAVQYWARHKKNTVIAAGLNKECSLMASEDWDSLSKTSNAVEQSAHKSYSYGKRLRLVRAIQVAHNLDMRDINQYTAREEFGIRHTSRATSMSSRYMNHLARDKRHQNRLSIRPDPNISDDEVDDSILFQSSSSGVIRSSSVPRTTRIPSRGRSRSASQLRRSSSAQELNSTSSPSSSGHFKRQALNTNIDLQNRRTALELRQKEAEIKKQELENLKLEIELQERQKALLSTR